MPLCRGHRALPGAQDRGAPGGALPPRSPLGGLVGGLLLRLRDLQPGLSPGRQDRRDQLACPGPAQRAARHPPARPAAGPSRRDGPVGPADTPALQLGHGHPPRARSGGTRRRHPSQGRGPQGGTAHLPAVGPPSPRPARPGPGRLLPRLQHQLLRAPARADGGRGARAPGTGSGDPGAGLLRAAAPVQRELPLRPRLRHPAGPPAPGSDGRRPGHRLLDQLRADAQARGPRDPGGGGPEPGRHLPAHLRHLRVPPRPARAGPAEDRLPTGGADRRLSRALPAAEINWSASPPWTSWPWCRG